MKTQKSSKVQRKCYIDLTNEARALQRDLLNLIDENLLSTRSVSRSGTMFAAEMQAEMERFTEDSYYNLNPVCVNLIETINRVLELQVKAYNLKTRGDLGS